MKQLVGVKEYNGFNTNDSDAETAEFSVKNANELHVYIEGDTGNWNTEVVEFWAAGQKEDGTSGKFYLLTTEDMQGEGHRQINMCTFSFVKAKVKTVEGSTSTVNIIFNAYWSPLGKRA